MLSTATSTGMIGSHVEEYAPGTFPALETMARKSLAQDCPYAYHFRSIEFRSRSGVLTVRGSLPSFYLKQVLIAHLLRVDGVRRIDDQIDIVCSNGLSSVRS